MFPLKAFEISLFLWFWIETTPLKTKRGICYKNCFVLKIVVACNVRLFSFSIFCFSKKDLT